MADSPSLLLPEELRWGEDELSVTHPRFRWLEWGGPYVSGYSSVESCSFEESRLLPRDFRRVFPKANLLIFFSPRWWSTDQISCWTIDLETHIHVSVWSFGGITGAISYDSISSVQPFKQKTIKAVSPSLQARVFFSGTRCENLVRINKTNKYPSSALKWVPPGNSVATINFLARL